MSGGNRAFGSQPSTSRNHLARCGTATSGKLYENKALTNRTHWCSHKCVTNSEYASTRTSEATDSTSSGAPHSLLTRSARFWSTSSSRPHMKPYLEKWNRGNRGAEACRTRSWRELLWPQVRGWHLLHQQLTQTYNGHVGRLHHSHVTTRNTIDFAPRPSPFSLPSPSLPVSSHALMR